MRPKLGLVTDATDITKKKFPGEGGAGLTCWCQRDGNFHGSDAIGMQWTCEWWKGLEYNVGMMTKVNSLDLCRVLML